MRYAAVVVKVLVIQLPIVLSNAPLDHCSASKHVDSTKPWTEVSSSFSVCNNVVEKVAGESNNCVHH